MSAVFIGNGFGETEGSAAAASLCSEQELTRAGETFQEYLTPHNVCMFVIIKEFLQLSHAAGASLDGSQLASVSGDTAGGDVSAGNASALAAGPESLVRTPGEKFELYNFILDQLDEGQQLFPMEALIARGRAAMKPALCKQVEKRMRQFFVKHQAKETRSPFHTLETYLSYTALNGLFRDEGRGGGNGSAAGIGLSSTSVCGLFMRKVVFAFQSRTFAQAYTFVGRLRMYYYGCVDANDTFSCPEDFRQRQSEEQELHTLGLLDANRFRPEDEPDAWQLDRRHAEVFVAQQAFLLEQNPAEAVPPRELECRLGQLCRLHPGLECLHFLRYLNAIRRRDRTGAERSLRTYFGLRGDRSGGAYDVMALAAMMHYFGFREESQMPLREALLHCLMQSDSGADRGRSPAELAFLQMKSDVRRLLTGAIPLRGVLTRILLDKAAGAQGKPRLVAASTLQHVLSACHLFGLHSVSCVLAQALLLTDLSERGVPLLNESVALAAAQLAVQLGELGALVLAQDLLSALLSGLSELRSPLTQALESAQSELQFQRALFASDYARATSIAGSSAAAAASAAASAAAAAVPGADESDPAAGRSRGVVGGVGGVCDEADSLLKRAAAQLGLANLHSARQLCSQALALLREDKGTPAAALSVRARLLLCEAALLGQCPSLCYPELAQCQQLAGGYLFSLGPLLRLYRAAAHHASGRPAEALAELVPARGYLLSQASVCLRSRLLLLEGQALATLGRLGPAVRRLLTARRGFRAVGCVSRERVCCLLLAHLHHRMGDVGLRNRAAAAFGRLPNVPDPVGVF